MAYPRELGIHFTPVVPIWCSPKQGSVWRRIFDDGLLYEPVEQHPPGAGGSLVEPEIGFVEVVVQVAELNGSLMRPQKPAFQERSDHVYSR